MLPLPGQSDFWGISRDDLVGGARFGDLGEIMRAAGTKETQDTEKSARHEAHNT